MRTSVAYGRTNLCVRVPDTAAILTPAALPTVPDPEAAVQGALTAPLGTPPLAELARGRAPGTACVVVSDITRPVPYHRILPPLLQTLLDSGFSRDRILILVATGMHRASSPKERDEMFGPSICRDFRIADHRAEDAATLQVLAERTTRGTLVRVDRRYMDADLKIATGLVEPHFMAGYSGGRKSICPGLVDLDTIQQFHGPDFLEDARATSGVLDGNPCHEEATDVARLAGVDFLLNVTLDVERRLTGVFGGDLDLAFRAAAARAADGCRVAVKEEADIVLTSGGGHPLDATFYQVVKGMVGANPAVRAGGTILVVAACAEGIGSPGYVDLMAEYDGRHEEFLRDIRNWGRVRRDQWELEMQCRSLRKVGVTGIVICTDGIPVSELARLSVTPAQAVADTPGSAEVRLQATLDACLARHGPEVRLAVVPKGPYVMLQAES